MTRLKKVKVTPEIAQLLLDHSAGNRQTTNGKVLDYARYYEQGWWREYDPAHPLRLADEYPKGLREGHHRCLAVIQYGKPVGFCIEEHCSAASARAGRHGGSWSLSDEMSVGIGDRKVDAVVAQKPNRNNRAKLACSMAQQYFYVMGRQQPSPTLHDIARFVKRFHASVDRVLDVSATDTKVGLRNATVGLSLVLLLHYCEGDQRITNRAEAFIEQLRSGEMLESGEPAYVLREYLLDRRRRHRDSRWRRSDTPWTAFLKVLRCCQAAATQERIKKLYAPEDAVTLVEWFLGESRADSLAAIDKVKTSLDDPADARA